MSNLLIVIWKFGCLEIKLYIVAFCCMMFCWFPSRSRLDCCDMSKKSVYLYSQPLMGRLFGNNHTVRSSPESFCTRSPVYSSSNKLCEDIHEVFNNCALFIDMFSSDTGICRLCLFTHTFNVWCVIRDLGQRTIPSVSWTDAYTESTAAEVEPGTRTVGRDAPYHYQINICLMLLFPWFRLQCN